MKGRTLVVVLLVIVLITVGGVYVAMKMTIDQMKKEPKDQIDEQTAIMEQVEQPSYDQWISL
ncbi:MAG TPA: hypothetical protein VK100_08720 [Pseudogracilibacillus sp.]|nr:hypothetical protein [Pseudogracilibacillus sp.]